jgi:hypothetical protein
MASDDAQFALGGDNKTCAAATVLINGASSGTYPNRPAISEDPQCPLANLLINDRGAVARTADALATAYPIDFDLGNDLPIGIVGVHGFRLAAGKVIPSTCEVSYRTSANGYDGNGAFTLLKTLSLDGRDRGSELAQPVRARYIRFRFPSTGGGFSVSNFYAGVIRYNLGATFNVLYSPGAAYTDVERRTEVETLSGLPITRIVGDGSLDISLPYQDIEAPLTAVIRTLARETLPITHLTPFDDFLQVQRRGGQFRREHQWHQPHQFNATLDLQGLA